MKTLIALVMMSAFTLSVNAQKIDIESRIDYFNTILGKSTPGKTPDSKLFPRKHKIQSPSANSMMEKSSFTGKQKLDSVVSEFFNDESAVWVNDSKEEYSYDNNGNMASYIYSSWDEENSEWIGDMKEETVFDDDGNMTLYIFSYWDEFENQWIASSRSEFIYEDGLVMYLHDYYWDEDQQEWLSSGSLEYEYQEGLLASITLGGADLNGDDLINELDQMRFSFFYDPQGNLLREVISMYPDEITGWFALMKSEYSYNSSGQVEQVLSYYIDEVSGEWIPESRELFTYNSFGKVISDSYDYWDYEKEDWQTNMLWQYYYNDDGDLLSMILSDWDYESGSMVPNFKNEYTHNSDYSLADLVLPYDYPPEYFAHMITGYSQYEFYEDDWIMTYRGEIFYSDFSTSGISVIPAGEFDFFPNPASDIVTFTGPFTPGKTTIKFFDITGKMVSSQILPENSEVSVQGFEAGVYLYTISEKGLRKTGKLVIK